MDGGPLLAYHYGMGADDVNRCARNALVAALLAAGATTFLIALLRRRRERTLLLYSRPEGGERLEDNVLFVG